MDSNKPIEFKNFRGIKRSVSDPPSNTFQDLLNLRNDRVLGGLVNRNGLSSVELPGFPPDAFGYTKFTDLETLLILGNHAIYAKPGIVSDSTENDFVDLTGTLKGVIATVETDNIVTVNETLPKLKYTICLNQSKSDYAVVIADVTTSSYQMNKDVSSWESDDVVIFFRNEMLLSDGETESLSNILTPSADVSIGRWQPSTPDLFSNIPTGIHTTLSSAVVPVDRLDPDSTLENVNFLTSESGQVHTLIGDGESANDSNYVYFVGTPLPGESGFPLFVRFKYSEASVVRWTTPIMSFGFLNEWSELRTEIPDSFGSSVGVSSPDDGELTIELLHLQPSPVVSASFTVTLSDLENLYRNNSYSSFITTRYQVIKNIAGFMIGIKISWVKFEVPVLETTGHASDSFEVELSDLVGVTVNPAGVTTISYKATVQNASSLALFETTLLESGNIVATTRQVFTINTAEISMAVDNSLITDTTNLTVKVQVFCNGQNVLVTVKELKAVVDVLRQIEVPAGELIYNKIGYPRFVQIDGFGSQYLDGVESLSKDGLWVGRIKDRKFFGDTGFSYNGIYVTTLSERFNSGTFRSADHHLSLKKIGSASVGSPSVDPNAVTNSTGFTPAGGASDDLDAIDTDDGKYLQLTSATGSFEVTFDTPLDIVDSNGSVFLTIKMRNGSTYQLSFLCGRVTNFTTLKVVVGGFTTPTIGDSMVVSVVDEANGVLVSEGMVVGALEVNYMFLEIPLQTISVIEVPTGESFRFAINFALIRDGFNRSQLIYAGNYGEIAEDPVSYVLSNQIQLNSSGIISLKISVKNAEIINRRITGIELYGSIIQENPVWRFLKTISIDSGRWQYSSGVYSCEVLIGSEILDEESYETRLAVSSSYKPVFSTTGFVCDDNRSYVIPSEDRRIIVFSPNSEVGTLTGVLPSGNFIQTVKTSGDNLALLSINRKLIVFKRGSHLSYSIEAIDAGRPEVLSYTDGLASIAGLAQSDRRVAYFPSYSGIIATDGFKSEVVNQDWLDVYLSYDIEDIENSIGFFDAFSDSYYIKIGNDLWALNINSLDWRREDFSYRYSTDIKLGTIGYVVQDLNSRIVFSDDVENSGEDFVQLYQFPRVGDIYTNRFITPIGVVEQSTVCLLLTNHVDEGTLRIGNYINDGYIKFAVLGSTVLEEKSFNNQFQRSDLIKFTVYTGASGIKVVTLPALRSEFPLVIRKPLSRFAIGLSFRASQKIALREFGVMVNRMIKTGSVKQES